MVIAVLIADKNHMETEAKEHPKSQRLSPGELVALTAAAIALLGVILSLLGFGVAVAASSLFGIPYNTMLQSPFDALLLSVPVIAMGLLRWIAFDAEIYTRVAPVLLLILGLIVCGAFLLTILAWAVRRKWARAICETRLSKSMPQSDASKDSLKAMLMARVVAPAAFWVIALPSGTFLVLLLLGIACSVVAFVPLLGMEVGRTYLYTYVIAAEACVPMRDSAAHTEREAMRKRGEKRESRPGATCVRVERSDGTSITGRVALSTSSAILIYDPRSGIARHIPASDAVIETVDELLSVPDSPSDT